MRKHHKNKRWKEDDMNEAPHQQSDAESGSLDRFLIAQESEFQEVLIELKASRKWSQRMWHTFRQIAGLGLWGYPATYFSQYRNR